MNTGLIMHILFVKYHFDEMPQYTEAIRQMKGHIA